MSTLNLDKPWAWYWFIVALILRLYFLWNIPWLIVILPFIVVPIFFLLFVGSILAFYALTIIVALVATIPSTFNNR